MTQSTDTRALLASNHTAELPFGSLTFKLNVTWVSSIKALVFRL